MEAFEKWLKENSEKSGWLYDRQAREQRKMGWNAALRWVLSQPDGSCGVRKCIPMEAIRDELEE